MNFCGAQVLVANLKAQGIKYVFGVPGAKIDRVYDALLNSGIETVVCRHEQNASFIAAGVGKLTEKPGVFGNLGTRLHEPDHRLTGPALTSRN
jgi:acetolactate synthase-1/2/3 large subunit